MHEAYFSAKNAPEEIKRKFSDSGRDPDAAKYDFRRQAWEKGKTVSKRTYGDVFRRGEARKPPRGTSIE
jgi:hypothetical protein